MKGIAPYSIWCMLNGNMKQVVKYNGILMYHDEVHEYMEMLKSVRAKTVRKQTVIKNIKNKSLLWYVTFTINKNWKDAYTETDLKRLQDSIRKLMKDLNIDYFLVPEVQPKSQLFHFHGFISDNDYLVFSGKLDKYKNKVYHFVPLQDKFGFTSCIYLFDKKPYVKSKIISYVVKYITKSGYRAMSNRTALKGKYSDVFNFFGLSLVNIEK